MWTVQCSYLHGNFLKTCLKSTHCGQCSEGMQWSCQTGNAISRWRPHDYVKVQCSTPMCMCVEGEGDADPAAALEGRPGA